MKSLLQILERKLARYAVPHVSLLIALGQVAVLAMLITQPQLSARLSLVPHLVLMGEWYRLASFVILPPGTDILTLFGIYLFYFMGESLEAQWGTVRYNLYLLIAYLATLAVAWINPAFPTYSTYIGGSVFLAFAWLYPDFELMIMFIIPVKIRYLALLTWLLFLWTLATGTLSAKLAVLASVANFLLFFGNDIFWRMRSGKRKMETGFARLRQRNVPLHRCTICGITEREDRNLDFRFCSKCHGAFEYCEIHLGNHEHKVEAKPTESR
ncbi:MAG: hypothetical protein V4719_14310 [Planctomycetota bacterium]